MSKNHTRISALVGPIVIGILVCEGVGVAAAWATQTAVTTWYPTLVKPAFTPPNWLFGPVWTILYAMMGGAAALVWGAGRESQLRNRALILFGGQLVLNAAWSFAFFWARSPTIGLVVILLLWLVLGWTLRRFFQVRALAGWLLVPYLLWVSYAVALNGGVWWLN